MKRLLFPATLVLMLCIGVLCNIGCGNTKKSWDVPDTLDVDSMNLADENILPEGAEELFDDFFFNFASNKALQYSRILFPLAISTDGKVTKMQKEQWKMEQFFINEDYYTLLFDSEEDIDRAHDTSIDNAVVERFDMSNNRQTRYSFGRKDGHWVMTGIEKSDMQLNRNAAFLKFYDKFVNDEAFQKQSIANPLEFSGPDPDDDFSRMEGLISPEQWFAFRPFLPSGVIYNIEYGTPMNEGTTKLFLIRGIANEMLNGLTFRLKGGKWKLTRLSM